MNNILARTTLLILLLFLTEIAISQFNVIQVPSSDIPKNILYEGHLINCVRWTDALGVNLLITTETGSIPSKSAYNEDVNDAYLYAYHFIISADSNILTWHVTDYAKDCEVDIWAKYLKNTFAVTDLDKNGYGEVWLMYKTVCHGDVSPSNMKIIMYENNKKYAVRGTNKVKVGEGVYEGGENVYDENFKTGPVLFKNYAAKLWSENIMENWE